MKSGIGSIAAWVEVLDTGSTVIPFFLDLCYAGWQELGHSLLRMNACQACNKLAEGVNNVEFCIRHGIVENKIQNEIKQWVREM